VKSNWIKCQDQTWVNLDQIEYVNVIQNLDGTFSVRAYGSVACDHIIAIFQELDEAYDHMDTIMNEVKRSTTPP
jgi:hypothetical protein